MSNFMPLVRREYEFEGDTISVSFTRLTRQQMIEISPYLPKDDHGLSEDDNMSLIGKAIDILKKNVVDFSGLKNANGEPLAFLDIIDDTYFFSLSTDMVKDLMGESMLSVKKEKPQKEESIESVEGTKDSMGQVLLSAASD